MTDVDLSSYPKPSLPVSPLDTAAKLGSMQQQSLQIDNSKIELAQKALNALGTAVTSLGPDASKEEYKAVGLNVAKAFNLPPQAVQSWNERIDTAATPREFYNQAVTAIGDHGAAVGYHLGQRENVGNGQTVTPSVSSVKPGFGVRPIAAPIQQQPSVDTEVVGPDGVQRLGPQAPQLPAGARPVPGAVPGSYRLPVAPTPSAANPSGVIKPAGSMASQPPGYAEGLKQRTDDQNIASEKLTALKPAQQALKLLKGVNTGPGTSQLNDLMATAKALGIINIKPTDDPTAIYQEITKKLAQYVSNNPVGQRSDSAQALKEAASPSPKTQISPAIIKLTRDAIALDRVQAAMPNAFKGKDFNNYGEHRSKFPQTIDERAFTVDLLGPEERNALITTMKKKANTSEGKKFWKSLSIADEQGFMNLNDE